MAKLHFKYSTMNAGKSLDLLKTAHNYEENNFKVLVLKPIIDTKAGDKIVTRVSDNFSRKVDYLIDVNQDIGEMLNGKLNDIKCILVEESQFLSKEQINQLYIISKFLDVTVICYGLRTNFKMEFFTGSKRLMEIADELEELRTICSCGYTAKFVGRKVNGEFVSSGEEVVIDGQANVEYLPLCGVCYLEKVLGIKNKCKKKVK